MKFEITELDTTYAYTKDCESILKNDVQNQLHIIVCISEQSLQCSPQIVVTLLV